MFPGSIVGQIFADQIAVTIRHHALESGCFVVNATGWLDEIQVAKIAKGTGLENALRGGCYTAIIAPDGSLLCEPLTEGEGIVYAELDFRLITKRKRMMDSVGHYSRPELLSLSLDSGVKTPLRAAAQPAAATRPGAEENLQTDGGAHDSAASFGAAGG
jgi:aliphatic nitrilase